MLAIRGSKPLIDHPRARTNRTTR